MKTVKRWKFLRQKRTAITSENGKCTWKIGELKTYEKPLQMCSAGFHCSKEIYQAFSYVHGEVLALVECFGNHEEQNDKEVWEQMKIVKAYKWQKQDSVALSIYAAELVIQNFEKVYPDDKRPREAIEAAKKWLKNPTEENQKAAESAARSAAWSVRSAAWSAESAAWSAARSAESAAWSARSAESAARSAAWSARSAAWSARSAESAAWSVRSALIKDISIWMDKRVKKLEEISPTQSLATQRKT